MWYSLIPKKTADPDPMVWAVIPDTIFLIPDPIPLIPDPTYLVTSLVYHLGDRFGEKAFLLKILFI